MNVNLYIGFVVLLMLTWSYGEDTETTPEPTVGTTIASTSPQETPFLTLSTSENENKDVVEETVVTEQGDRTAPLLNRTRSSEEDESVTTVRPLEESDELLSNVTTSETPPNTTSAGTNVTTNSVVTTQSTVHNITDTVVASDTEMTTTSPETEGTTVWSDDHQIDLNVTQMNDTTTVTDSPSDTSGLSSQTSVHQHIVNDEEDIVTVIFHPVHSIMTWIFIDDPTFRGNLMSTINNFDLEDNNWTCPLSLRHIMYVSPTPVLVDDSLVISLIVKCDDDHRLPGALLWHLLTLGNSTLASQISSNVTSIIRGKPTLHIDMSEHEESILESYTHIIAFIIIIAIVAASVVCIVFICTKCRASKESWDPIAFGNKYQVDGRTRHIPEDGGIHLAHDRDCLEGEGLKSRYLNGRYPELDHDNWVFPAESMSHNGVKTKQEDTKL